MLPKLPAPWRPLLAAETGEPYFRELEKFVERERRSHTVYPPEKETFEALRLTPYRGVNVLLLGQDPYPGKGQAHGLCFSVRPGVKPPASLRNIYAELAEDVGFRVPDNGYLAPWAKQGILMLNAVLTVRAGEPNSHKGKGWERFTDAVIRRVSEKEDAVVFVLWGAYAQKKIKLIDTGRHAVIKSAHPSPLSAHNGFFGSRPFSRANAALAEAGREPVDWRLPPA